MVVLRWHGDPLREAIYKVKQQVHPGRPHLTPRSMALLVRLVGGVGLCIAQRAKTFAISSKMVTVCSRAIQTATRVILDDELAKHAVTEGTRAVVRFEN